MSKYDDTGFLKSDRWQELISEYATLVLPSGSSVMVFKSQVKTGAYRVRYVGPDEVVGASGEKIYGPLCEAFVDGVRGASDFLSRVTGYYFPISEKGLTMYLSKGDKIHNITMNIDGRIHDI